MTLVMTVQFDDEPLAGQVQNFSGLTVCSKYIGKLVL